MPPAPKRFHLILWIGVMMWVGIAGLSAQEVAPPSQETAEFRESIQTTLSQVEYQWRLPRDLTAADEGEGSTFFRNLLDDFKDWFKTVGERFEAWKDKYFNDGDKTATKSEGWGGSFQVESVTSWVLIAVVVGLVAWLAWMLFKNWQGRAPIEVLGEESMLPIDLASESIVADQLPEDEWTRLANEQLATGNHVLAVRALFLATLANLGERGLLRIARGKSNRDYSRELALKARTEGPELIPAFRENVGAFEQVWYGLHQIGGEAVEQFRANYNAITGATSSALIDSKPQPEDTP